MKKNFIVMDTTKDNCGTTLDDISKNEEIKINDNLFVKINHNIDLGHKFALKDIKRGEYLFKYGEIIGIATEDIKAGDWIHIHNIKSYYLERATNND